MTPDELVWQDCRAWMEKASIDLRSAAALIDSEIPSSALFHCQQAAEKSLKAFLTVRGVAFRRVHDLEELGVLCVEADPTLAAIVKLAPRWCADKECPGPQSQVPRNRPLRQGAAVHHFVFL